MKLGDVVQIAIGVPALAESCAFYEKLGFEKIAANDAPWPWAQFTDGENLVLLNQDGNQYTGLNYFSTNVAERVAEIEAKEVQFMMKNEQDGRLQMAIFSDSDGLMVGLINHDAAQIPAVNGEPLSYCGKFGEFSLGVANFKKAADFWHQFGFETRHASYEPYPWGVLSDGMMVLGLHQTDEFAGPIMTYFASDMAKRIEKLAEKGLKVENGTLQAPGGETLFLFSWEE
jgi:catechol 2,3-dioxygenase-like lactoylglutathione lyase family enzyme/predicted enzyme related to lactoylglutathione lyase